MTLQAMAASYHHSADLLMKRIRELKAQAKSQEGPEKTAEAAELEHRIRDLSIMYRETRSTAQALERYYNGKGIG